MMFCISHRLLLAFALGFLTRHIIFSLSPGCPPVLNSRKKASDDQEQVQKIKSVSCVNSLPSLVSRRSSDESVIGYDLIPCLSSFGYRNKTSGFFPTYKEAGGARLTSGTKMTGVVPHLKTVLVVGKGESSISTRKTDDVLIATVNHALAWQNYSDIHFQNDYYFHEVEVDFFCRARILVVPTYFHVEGRYHVHASVLLDHLRFSGPIFLVELPDGPPDALKKIQSFRGAEITHSSGDLAFAWLLRQGYRRFESYGIGGSGYSKFYVNQAFSMPNRFVQNQKVHTAHIRKRISAHNATWIQH